MRQTGFDPGGHLGGAKGFGSRGMDHKFRQQRGVLLLTSVQGVEWRIIGSFVHLDIVVLFESVLL